MKFSACGSDRNRTSPGTLGNLHRHSGGRDKVPCWGSSQHRLKVMICWSTEVFFFSGSSGPGCQYAITGEFRSCESSFRMTGILLSAELPFPSETGTGIGSEMPELGMEVDRDGARGRNPLPLSSCIRGGEVPAVEGTIVENSSSHLPPVGYGRVELLGLGSVSENRLPCETRGEGSGEGPLGPVLDRSGVKSESGSVPVRRGRGRSDLLERLLLTLSLP